MKKDKLLKNLKRMRERKRPIKFKMRKIKPFLRRIASDIKQSWRIQLKEKEEAKIMELSLVVKSALLEDLKNET